MKKQKFSRAMALLMTVFMVVSMCPLMAFADEEESLPENDTVVVSADDMIVVDGILYGISKTWFDEQNFNGKPCLALKISESGGVKI